MSPIWIGSWVDQFSTDDSLALNKTWEFTLSSLSTRVRLRARDCSGIRAVIAAQHRIQRPSGDSRQSRTIGPQRAL